MECFADDPIAFFSQDSAHPQYISLAKQESLQLQVLQKRFARMREFLPPLDALAKVSRTEKIKRIEDVAPLMFPHTLFKSYPQHLVANMRFPELTEWLSRITLSDLSAVKGRHYDAFDNWLEALDTTTESLVYTSSGTTGALSLFPRSRRDLAMAKKRFLKPWTEPGQPKSVVESVSACFLWLTYSHGRTAMLRGADFFRDLQAEGHAKFLPLLEARQSTDLQIYASRATAAREQNGSWPALTAHLQRVIDDANELHRTMDERIQVFLQTVREKFRDTPAILTGGPIMVHRVAVEGLKLGMEPGLAPGSAVSCGGGTKGAPTPMDLEKTIRRFAGVGKVGETYGMSEITDVLSECSEGNFHTWPWIIPMLFKVEDGKLLPRRGTQRGRAAFFDLSAQMHWGGIVSGDDVSISWETCRCGRTTPHVKKPISRIPSAETEEHVFGAATPAAIHAAFEALNSDLR